MRSATSTTTTVTGSESRRRLALIVLTGLAITLTIALGTVCILIWADAGIEHASLVDRETLIGISGFLLFYVFAHVVGGWSVLARSNLLLFVFCTAIVIAAAGDVVIGSLAAVRYNDLWADGAGDKPLRKEWLALPDPEKLNVQNELNCCGFSSPLDKAVTSAQCSTASTLTGCENPWRDFLSYEAVGISTTFFATCAMHLLMCVVTVGLLVAGYRDAAAEGSSSLEETSVQEEYYWVSESDLKRMSAATAPTPPFAARPVSSNVLVVPPPAITRRPDSSRYPTAATTMAAAAPRSSVAFDFARMANPYPSPLLDGEAAVHLEPAEEEDPEEGAEIPLTRPASRAAAGVFKSMAVRRSACFVERTNSSSSHKARVEEVATPSSATKRLSTASVTSEASLRTFYTAREPPVSYMDFDLPPLPKTL